MFKNMDSNKLLSKVGSWYLVCWLFSQIYDQLMCYCRWKMTFGGRQPLLEDDLWWKTTFGGRQPSMEDGVGGRRPLFGERQPSVEDNLRWKTTFVGRWLLVEDDILLNKLHNCIFQVISVCSIIQHYNIVFALAGRIVNLTNESCRNY